MSVKWDTAATTDRVRRAVGRGVMATAEWVKNDAVRRIIEPPKTGELYVGAPFRIGLPPHQASAPGESPADDSGALKASGRVDKVNDLKASVKFGGIGGVDYARDLEFGILTGDKPLEARPYLRPALLAGMKQVKRIIEEELAK